MKNNRKNVSISAVALCAIICKMIALVLIIAFVFTIVLITNNLKLLWLLFLVLTVKLLPDYSVTYSRNTKGDSDTDKSN